MLSTKRSRNKERDKAHIVAEPKVVRERESERRLEEFSVMRGERDG